jgi:hypothetical protein
LTADWVIGRQRQLLNGGAGSGELDHEIGQLCDGELARVAKVDRTRDSVWRVHHPQQTIHKITDITE